MKKMPNRFGWLAVLLLCSASALIYIFAERCRFLALVVLGIAAVVACYLLLDLLKKRKETLARRLLWIFTALLCIGLLAATVTGIFVGSAATGSGGDCRYIIVLGSGVQGTEPSPTLQDRIHTAFAYLTEHPDVVCIVSGAQGPGEDITEAQCMATELTAMGIDPSRIWLEDRSTSTRENIAFSLALIEKQTGTRPDTAGILSSEYHLYRAAAVANAQGLTPVTIPARTSQFHLFLNGFLREIFVTWAYAILY